MPDLHQQYEDRHVRQIINTNKKILSHYQDAIQEVSLGVSRITFEGQVFDIKNYPSLKNKIDQVISKTQPKVYGAMVNSIKDSWDLSNKKNNLLLDKRVADKKLKPKAGKILYDPNKEALKKFLDRKDKGMNLSDRVWQTMEPFKTELEAGLGLAISKGKSAADTAREMKRYLQRPDELFRRVADEKDKLKLSDPAKAFHPGQGIYRSSYKNALRLTRTENNIAYRTADHERWKVMPFVTGIIVRLSRSHPRYDICDPLVGEYPKDFKFTGWHPQCLCYAVPKMMTDEEYSRYEDSILEIAEFDPKSVKEVKKPPASFSSYVAENKEKLLAYKNTPYWITDNRKYFDQAKKARVPNAKSLKPGGQPVRKQFTDIESSIETEVSKSLTNIDNVHGDGILEDIPFKEVDEHYNAAFLSKMGNPLEIHLSSNCDSPELSLAHEMGHYFDLHALGKRGTWESETKGSEIRNIVNAAKKTDAIKSIQKIIKDGKLEFEGTEYPVTLGLKNHLQYLLHPKEIWARSYAQFIAKRSGSAAMQTQVRKLMNLNNISYQWADDDFLKIEQRIERYFFNIGWMVSQ